MTKGDIDANGHPDRRIAMSFSVVGSVNHLTSEYRRFLLSTYRLADKKLRDQFEDHIKQADVLVKGP